MSKVTLLITGREMLEPKCQTPGLIHFKKPR